MYWKGEKTMAPGLFGILEFKKVNYFHLQTGWRGYGDSGRCEAPHPGPLS